MRRDTSVPRKVKRESTRGFSQLDRTRRLAEILLERHPESFGPDYAKNKVALRDLALIPSKQLRNHIAGYLANALKEDTEETETTQTEEQAE
ncbi:MAG: 30S ribosomal protein S17e [Thaumarchaeota archaeon]|nr:30S ribosomal protein S17e [Nitrososphaerota archaeon]